MFVVAVELAVIYYGLIFWQVQTTEGTFDHVLDLFLRALVSGLFFGPRIANKQNYNPHSEGNKQNS